MDRILGRPAGIAERAIDFSPEAELTPESLKVELAEVMPAEIAPLAPQQAMELVGAVRHSDQLRLDVPQSLSPYTSSPYGPQHDYMMVRNMVSRSKEPEWRQFLGRLAQPLPGVNDRALTYMRGAASREANMLNLVEKWGDWMDQIYARMIGSQEG